MVGSNPVGWDTIASYVPSTLDIASGNVGLLTTIGMAPLMYLISVPAYLITGINPVWIFKIMGPILYGSMSWALFRFLRFGLNWPEKRTLGAVLLSSIYFVTLRISWDLYRNMFGLTFILLSLPLLEEGKGPPRKLSLALLLLLAVASDQLTGVIALVLVGARAIYFLLTSRRAQFIESLRIGVPGAALFFLTVYAGQILSGQGLFRAQPAIPESMVIWSSIGFLGYAFLPLLPFAAIGASGIVNLELKVWTSFCTAAALIALFPFYGLIVESYRWTLLLDVPMCVFAASGIVRVRRMASSMPRLINHIAAKAFTPISLVILFLCVLYLASPAQQAFAYYVAFPSFVPTSMVQNSVPLSDMGSLRIALGWLEAHMGPGDVLLTHQAIYGWARAYLPSTDHIINYGYSNPLDGVSEAISAGYSTSWVIWWIPGLGWHGQMCLPEGFTATFQNGDMAVYAYG